MPRIVLTVTALLSAIAVATGCGNGSSSASGAASLAPAGAVVYGEATLDPSDDQQAAIDALIEKFPGEGSAGERIRGLLEKAFSESDIGLSYAKDIEPWLGDQAGFFVSSLEPGADSSAALLVATRLASFHCPHRRVEDYFNHVVAPINAGEVGELAIVCSTGAVRARRCPRSTAPGWWR